MREIALTRGYTAQVDDEDYGAVLSAGPWFTSTAVNLNRDGACVYAYPCRGIHINGKRGLQTMGAFLLGGLANHRDHNGMNCQRRNLRLPGRRGLNRSSNRISKTGLTSQYRGVSWSKAKARWVAQISIESRSTHLGYFADEVSAAHAYDAAALREYGEFATPNFFTEVTTQ